MVSLRVHFKAGIPIYEQVLYVARKAIISGALKPGDVFPSVRTISRENKINPNTVQKAVNVLKTEGLVEIVPGIGARVRAVPASTKADRAQMLGGDLEALVLRAKQLNLELDDVRDALAKHWKSL